MPPFKSGSRLPSYFALSPWLRYHSVFSSIHFWGILVKPVVLVVLTEAIVETFKELKNAMMTYGMKIIFVGWDSKVLSKIYYEIPSRLHNLN
jgi:hypothetical protein